MARTIDEIFQSMRQEGIRLATDANLPDVVDMFNSSSRVAIWKIIFFAIAFCANAVETIFDLLKVFIDNLIATKKPHSQRWFVEKTKAFQYGYNLVPETDVYDNTGLTDDQIAASQIIAYAAAVDTEQGIRIKVAKLIGDDLGPLTVDELAALVAYWRQIKPGGVKLQNTTGDPDDLKAKLRVYYDAQVITNAGARIDGSDNEPVQNALKTYLKNLPFNGVFVPMLAIDALQKVEGVVIVKDDYWQSKFGGFDFTGIDVELNPDAGYLRLVDGGLDIQFIAHAII